MTAVGWGFDAHQFGGSPPLVLAGVVVDADRGVEATSDGDVVAHAVADAVLGAGALGDIGMHFPSTDPASQGIDSMIIVADAGGRLAASGATIVHVDVTVIAEQVHVSPHRDAILRSLATALHLDPRSVSVKATSTDGLGFIGRDEGIAAVAVVTVESGPALGVPSGNA